MRILLGRTFYGLGDWIMFTSLIKHINTQHPDWVIDVDTTELPEFFLQFLCKFDIRVTPVCNPCVSAYDVYIRHVTYGPHRKPGVHLLEDMVAQFNTYIGVSGHKLTYDPTCLARHVGVRSHTLATVNSSPIVIAPEHSSLRFNANKGWGFENFISLAKHLLAARLEIIQIGTDKMSSLWPGAHKHYKNLSLGDMLRIMTGAAATVTLENGISHLAGHHGLKVYTIYKPTAVTQPSNAYYPGQIAITGELLVPDKLSARIISDYGMTRALTIQNDI